MPQIIHKFTSADTGQPSPAGAGRSAVLNKVMNASKQEHCVPVLVPARSERQRLNEATTTTGWLYIDAHRDDFAARIAHLADQQDRGDPRPRTDSLQLPRSLALMFRDLSTEEQQTLLALNQVLRASVHGVKIAPWASQFDA